MDIRLIAVPYDSGIRGWRMGAGPDHLLAAGAEDRLRVAGHTVSTEHIDLGPAAQLPEIRATFDIAARLSERVAAARAEGALPIVLSGNCATALGTLAGLADAEPAVLWLDAHADFNTPETTRSGMLDGMTLAIAHGRCWTALAATIPGFRPIPESRIRLLGARDMDVGEKELLSEPGIPVLPARDVPGVLSAALDSVWLETRTAYLHIDLDVLDPGEGTVNAFAAPGGLALDEVLDLVRAVRKRFTLGAVALTAYDPSYDADGRIARAALAILDELAAGA
jgi:arginase